MKLLVIGSSDTGGSTLPDPSQAWPFLVAAEIEPIIGEPLDVTDLPLVPAGPKAVPRVEAALAKAEPDIVVFAFGGYHFLVGTVGLRVRRRYGERAYRLFRRLELRFEGMTADAHGGRARLNRAGRRLARIVIGAEPLATEEEVTSIELEIMRQLSQREGTIVVIMYAPPLADGVDRENKGANRRLAVHRDFMNAAARRHHFLIADCIPGFAAAATSPLRHSDGVHKNAAGHRIQADAIMAALLSEPSPLAEHAKPGAAVAAR
jgi:hypothetical protein